jgi:predicted dinucleotide-binding enzyme
MAAKQTIAIVGASGAMGSALAESLSRSDYRLLLMSRNKSKLSRLMAHLKKGATTEIDQVECEMEACWEADIIILAVPYRAEKEVAEKIRQVASQKVSQKQAAWW